jgi:hypothetical protein
LGGLTKPLSARHALLMSAGFLVQLLISGLAVAALVGLAAWLGVPRPAPLLDAACARVLLAEEYPDAMLDRLWIAPDGLSALARSRDEALIIYRSGDGYVIRSTPWTSVASSSAIRKGRAILQLNDVAAPRATFTLPDGAPWPPKDLAVAELGT